MLDAAGQALDARTQVAAERLGAALGEQLRLVALWPDLDAAQDLAVDDVDKRLAESLARLAEAAGPGATAIAIDTTGRIVAASAPGEIGRVAAGRAASPVPLRVESGPTPDVWLEAPVWSRADGHRLGTIEVRSPWEALLASLIRDPATTRVRDLAGPVLHEGAVIATTDSTALLWSRREVSGLAGLHLEVAGVLPRTTALAPLRARARQLLVFAVVLLSVTVPAAFWLAHSTTAALRGLTRAAGADAPGAFVLPATAPREVRVLGDALSAMVMRLEASRHALARQETLAAMGTMAAGLAHEVRTPLAVLRTSAETLARRAGDDTTTELVTFIRDEVDRLDRLVDELLLFARPRPPEPTRLNLADVGARAVRILTPRAEEAGVRISLETTDAFVMADPDQLFQVLLNVLTNAIQVTPRQGMVRLETAGHADGARVVIDDAGPGIPADRRDEIWRPFFTTRRGGTGLGLAIVRRIVEAHDGTIEVADAPGAGARFTIRLPEIA